MTPSPFHRAIEMAAKVCEQIGDEKVERWAGSELSEDAKATAWDLSVAATRIRALHPDAESAGWDGEVTEAMVLAGLIRQHNCKPDTPFSAFAESEISYLKRIYKAMRAAAPVAGWMPIEGAPRGKKVLVAYKNRLGNWRRVTAAYYLPETLESEFSESGFADEGWYEESETQEVILPTDGEPELWHELPPLPAPPSQKEGE